MIRNQRDRDPATKQEDNTGSDPKAPTTSSRLWSGLRNPRIVRVSRAFGGKDRHSKVSTVRGLRDRRVRLSVQTAIQLYDLQDRLGLNQPSKVVDWLLNAAQHEIDKLPPLQIPPEGFTQFSQSLPQAPSAQANGEGLMMSFSQSTHWNSDAPQRNKEREDLKEPLREKGNTVHGNDLASHSSVSSFLSNTMPYASYYQWEAANAYLSQLGIRSSQSNNEAPVMSIPSSRSLALESQIVFCPPGIMPPMFQSNAATPTDFNMKQFGQLQMLSSISRTPQSDLEINSLPLRSPSARPFQ